MQFKIITSQLNPHFTFNAFTDLKKQGRIDIKIKNEDSKIKIQILDNGIGRARAKQNASYKKVVSTGVGVKAMKDYIDLLNKQNSHKIKLRILDIYDNSLAKGTLVEIVIPTKFNYSIAL